MAFSPRTPSDASFRDPFQLDRLADELATRELSTSSAKRLLLGEDDYPDLPEHVPLSHGDKYLTADVFNVEEFLLDRSHTSLPDLRTELREYLAELKEELVKLINDDYEAFISLSTDLRDEGARLERLKHPLSSLKSNIIESKQELQAIQNAIHDKLTSRAKLREEKALLHLLLKISESVMRLESLLLIASPDQGVQDMNNANFLMYSSHSEDNSDERFRGNRAKHLSRVAAEYTQLLYHVRKARAEKCAFVDEVQWRIDRVQSTLSSDLDQLFSQTLLSLVDSKAESRASELERTKWITDLTECLRTYDVLGLWRDAEDVIRRDVIRSFIKKTIYPGALAAPHSPLVPHTPFHYGGSDPMTSALTAHQIPYTPFTAFVPKQNSYRMSDAAADLPRAHLLEETDDSLARLYNQLLRFIERDVCRIMDLAEKVTVKPSAEIPLEKAADLSPTQNDGLADDDKRGFQIMAQVVWDEVGRSIMDEIGGVVFAAGRPNEFRKHYETTQAFIRSLELLSPSKESVEELRHHPVYLAFERRWQLPVYFQLRWKEIVGTLEDTLAITRLEPITPKDGSFATPQAAAAWIAVSACWSSEIYIPELGHRFWRLTLQILNRFKLWLDESISVGESSSKGTSNEKTLTSPNIPRSSTPVSSEAPSAESTAADDALLRRYSAALVDIRSMETNTLTLWRQVIGMMMPDIPEEDLEAEDALRESLSGLNSLTNPISTKVIAILTKRCYDNLLQVRSIPSQFKMSNKPPPTEPSHFVSSILRPVKQFFAIGAAEGPGSLLKDAFLKTYSTEVFSNVAQRYISYLTAMKKTVESLKRLRKNTRPTFSLFSNSSNANDEVREEERIRSQMILDVEAFGKDARSLHVDVDANQHFAVLKEIVYASDPE